MVEITLKQMADADQLGRFVVEHAADKMAAFHSVAQIADSLTQLKVPDVPLLQELFRERVNVGCVRTVEGTLGLSDLSFVDDEIHLRREPNLQSVRQGLDAVEQLAMVLRELQNRDMKPQANLLFNRYFDATGGVLNDPHTLTLLGHWLNQGDAAIQHSPKLIAVGGLSGSGKSRMARMLAPYFACPAGARVVRTDVVRKRMMGVGLQEKLGSHGYTDEATAQTYQFFYNEIRVGLEQGHSVIADGVFANDEQRAQVEDAARTVGAPFVGLWVDAPPNIRSQRVASRKNNVSDVTEEVLKSQLSYDLGDIRWHRIDSSGLKEDTLRMGRNLVGV